MATEQMNIPVVTPKVAKDVIKAAYESGKHPVMLWGPPGVGKTAVVYQAAEDMGLDGVVDFRLVTTEPTDLRGYPYLLKDADGNNVGMAWAPAGLLPKDPNWTGFVFLDELPQAPTMNMNAAAELVYDRRLGNDYTLPVGAMVITAGNRRTDRAGAIEVPTHMKNRLTHLEVRPEIESWAEWAKDKGIHEGIISFLTSVGGKHFNNFNADALAFPTPRSWEFASDFLKNEALSEEVRDTLVAGAVGRGAMMELKTFLRRGKGLPRYEDIIADPKNASLGSGENEAWALVGMVANSLETKDLDAAVIYLKRHRRELVRPTIHKIISKHPEFLADSKAFAELAKSVGESKS
jgi:MoxR-like ATPase